MGEANNCSWHMPTSSSAAQKSRYNANMIHIKKITFIRQINQTLKKQCQVNITKGFSSNAETFETENSASFMFLLLH